MKKVLILIVHVLLLMSCMDELGVMEELDTKNIIELEEPCLPCIVEMCSSMDDVIKGDTVMAIEGLDFYVSFIIEGFPKPTFEMYKRSTAIYEGGRYKFFFDDMLSFKIRKIKISDEGQYKIIVKNMYGEDSYDFYLKIITDD